MYKSMWAAKHAQKGRWVPACAGMTDSDAGPLEAQSITGFKGTKSHMTDLCRGRRQEVYTQYVGSSQEEQQPETEDVESVRLLMTTRTMLNKE